MIKRAVLAIAVVVSLASTLPVPALAAPSRVIDDNDTVSLRGSVHPLARPEFERGATDPALPMERIVISLRIAAEKQGALAKLLSDQQDPSSPNFHSWLSPQEFGERFAPRQEEIKQLTGWLASHGFTVHEVSRGGTSVTFSGTASTVERAFHTRMRDYVVDGRLRHANATDPVIPRGLADLVGGILSLHNFPRKTMNSGLRPLDAVASQDAIQPAYTGYDGSHYLSPADFATIYNVNPLYAAGIDGTGQSIAIVGRTHPSSSNWSYFRSMMGLPAKAVEVIVNGADPGDIGADEDGEADLDVEWSGAVAKNAAIKFVVSKSTYSTDGVDLSAQYIVNNNVAPVMSTSFGLCEAHMTSGDNAFYNNLWQQAAAQGITSFVSSGDSGAADCSGSNDSAGSGLAVNGLSSTPYNVSVGGTQFSDGGGGYWSSFNGSWYASALGYIPEGAWNESGNVSGGSGLWSTGGGASSIYAKPVWQAAPGVPADGKRDIPDVSLTAALHDGYLVRTQGALYYMGGTSASSPAFAGLMALIIQKTGQRQGNANPRFYQLGNAQYGSGGVKVFHDTTSGNNSVPGVTGFAATTGYDLATGLGSVDAYALVNNWAAPPAPLALGGSGALPNGTAGVAYSSTLTATGGTPPYTWSITAGRLSAGLAIGASTGVISGTPSTTGVFDFTVQVSDSSGASSSRNLSHVVSAAACANFPVLQGSAFYPDFISAYPLAADNDIIRLQALDFSADFLLDRDVRVTLAGGYDCGYTDNPAMTGLLGKLIVRGGTVKVAKLRLR